MKKIIMLAVASLFSNTFAADVIRFSTDGTFPPFSEINEKGEIVGFDVDIGWALCKEMKRECEFVQNDWEALIPALKAKKIDVILSSMSPTEERRKQVLFSDTYFDVPKVFVRKKGSGIELTEEGLKGKVFGILNASTFDTYIKDKYGKIATIKNYNSQEEANLDAIAGRVDILFAESVVLQDGFLDRGQSESFEVFGDPVVNEPAYFEGSAIGFRLEDEGLKDEYNKALKAIFENGEYKKISDKYFKSDVSGGKAK